MDRKMNKVVQFMPYLDGSECHRIKACFDNNWITEGKESQEFSSRLCDMLDVSYGVFAPNGTLALYLALLALGIKAGDEVIVPNCTFIATANAVVLMGAKPVFVDVDKTAQISVTDCERVVNKKTTAIIPVHLFGIAANMSDLLSFAARHELIVIEDAAQALGVKWDSQPCGSFGEAGCFSFFADKTITTGEGGFVATRQKKVYERLLYLRNQGRKERGTFIHPEVGYNFRITDIQAAIGNSQLDKFPEIVERKAAILDRYRRQVGDVVDILVPGNGLSTQIPFRVVVQTPRSANELIDELQDLGIEGRSVFYPLSKQPCYAAYQNDDRYASRHFPNSIHLHDHGLCLPSFPSISESEIDYVCECIRKLI